MGFLGSRSGSPRSCPWPTVRRFTSPWRYSGNRLQIIHVWVFLTVRQCVYTSANSTYCKLKAKLRRKKKKKLACISNRSDVWVFFAAVYVTTSLFLIYYTFKCVAQPYLTVVTCRSWPYVNPYALLSLPDGAKTLFVFCVLWGCTCWGCIYLFSILWHMFAKVGPVLYL